MERKLKPKKIKIALRAILILLMISILPVAIKSVIAHELKGSMWFYIAGFVLTVPDLLINTVIRPHKGRLTPTDLNFSYLTGAQKNIAITTISGYSITTEYTRAGMINGVVLYLNNGKKVLVTEMNIVSVLPLIDYLNEYQIKGYGIDRVRPWFLSSRYQY